MLQRNLFKLVHQGNVTGVLLPWYLLSGHQKQKLVMQESEN